MSTKLHNCGKLEIRKSPVEGFGVFATAPISAGEVLEEVPFVLFPRHTNLSKAIFDLLRDTKFLSDKEKYIENLRSNLKFKDPEKYYFKWFPPVHLDNEPMMFTVLPLGFGPVYNSSNTNNNAGWQMQESTFLFRAEKDIKVDEEIKTFYGYFLAQEGTIFACDAVFNLAIDIFDKVNRVKMFRFGSLDSFEAAKNNPTFARGHQLLAMAKDGLIVRRLALAQPNGEEIGSFNVTDDVPLNILYQKLAEFKAHPAPIVKIGIEYVNKTDEKVYSEPLTFRK